MGRRGSGEGSIYQDADGRWRAIVDLGWQDGRRRRKYLSGVTRAEVVARLRGVQRAQEDGQAVTSGDRPLTVEQRLMFWVDNIAARKVRYSTLSAYRGYIVDRIVPSLGRHRLHRLQPEHLETFCRKCEEQGLAAATVLQMHRVLSRALKVAVQRGRIPRNVATLVDSPSVKRPEVEPLTPEDARRVLATAESARNAARWSVPGRAGASRYADPRAQPDHPHIRHVQPRRAGARLRRRGPDGGRALDEGGQG
jgi:integrase